MMNLSLQDFCLAIHPLGLSNAHKAIAILWYRDREQPDCSMEPNELARIILQAGIGNPNSTNLAKQITATGMTLRGPGGMRLKHASRTTVQSWVSTVIDGVQPRIDQEQGFLSEAVWKKTRGYVESVCRQLNGCFVHAYYDAAAVMLRRLLETLIIEAYEALKREHEIQDSSGNYCMLGELVDKALGNGTTGLHLGRESKGTLKRVKEAGDRSAHNRRYLAVAADLQALQGGVRATVDELIHLANLRSK